MLNLKHKLITKSMALITVLSLTLCGCGAKTEEKEETGTFLDDKYIVAFVRNQYSADIIKFSNGDLVQLVYEDVFNRKTYHKKYYGTYKLEGHELIISIAGLEDIKCVLLEEKNCVIVNGNEKVEILDASDHIADEEEMNMFD